MYYVLSIYILFKKIVLFFFPLCVASFQKKFIFCVQKISKLIYWKTLLTKMIIELSRISINQNSVLSTFVCTILYFD
jgi:hypothetical protein